MDFEKNESEVWIYPPSLVAYVLIMAPNGRGLYDLDFKFKLLRLGSTEPPNFKKIGLAKIPQIDFKIDVIFYT